MLNLHPVNVYIDESLVSPVLVETNATTDFASFKYLITGNKKTARIRATVQSNNKYIQVTFVSPPKHVTIVNANNPTIACQFDGFPSDADEFRTVPFVAARINSLNDNRKLPAKVKDVASAMETNVVIRLFINEAIVCANDVKLKWYRRIWFLSTPIVDDTDCNNEHVLDYENVLIEEVKKFKETSIVNFASASRQTNFNRSVWAPVECRTGLLIAVVDLVFIFNN
ncbi:BV-ec31 [Euproctis pseudoconspersa nucleopolyhedrovirus]|uniref:BV-ec31 n=1 Tax=Euproctis pseudoconspersa nucleopolyhedrovirus TaxID=307467 RepID=C3TX40_9ABAC|nr:BV-ec31 [Euproctis pseudoconspersa nucleopolyhedrovirus]ACO53582.1 BV-ec31 [Euproctis pseudoconspersa nucleopolyhedrovirus]